MSFEARASVQTIIEQGRFRERNLKFLDALKSQASLGTLQRVPDTNEEIDKVGYSVEGFGTTVNLDGNSSVVLEHLSLSFLDSLVLRHSLRRDFYRLSVTGLGEGRQQTEHFEFPSGSRENEAAREIYSMATLAEKRGPLKPQRR